MRIKLRAIKKGAALQFEQPEAMLQAIKNIAENAVVDITITASPKTRPQLAYYWGIVIETMHREMVVKQGARLTKNDIHKTLVELYGSDLDVSESTQEEMEAYLNWCLEYARISWNTTIPEAAKGE